LGSDVYVDLYFVCGDCFRAQYDYVVFRDARALLSIWGHCAVGCAFFIDFFTFFETYKGGGAFAAGTA